MALPLPRMIQKLQPRCNIIVVTEHPEYALEALQIFVSGFLLKPANEADVRNVLENLRYPPETAPVGIKIQCFGNFEIFCGRTSALLQAQQEQGAAGLPCGPQRCHLYQRRDAGCPVGG